jgi:hypothetical protein
VEEEAAMIFVQQSGARLIRARMDSRDTFSLQFSGGYRVLGALVVGEEELLWFGQRPSRALPLEVIPVFRCPLCGMRSTNPVDICEGFCGKCRDWTGIPR